MSLEQAFWKMTVAEMNNTAVESTEAEAAVATVKKGVETEAE